mgnify:FL=1
MSLSKNIYTTSKDFFKQKLTTAFDSTGQSQNINDDQNLFAINCVRYLLADELTFIDPIQKEADFKNFAKFLRLNDFEANGKNLDTGTGREIANNLIYRLAIQFLKTKNENLQEIESKITLVNRAFDYPDFEGEFLLNVFLDEPETYQCITKQAFYKWHYSTYVNDTPLQEKLPQQNFLDFSSLGWTNVDVPLLTPKAQKKKVNTTFYISQDGSPYNTGYPIVCAVFEVGGIKGIDQFLSSDRFSEIENRLEEQVSNLFNRQKVDLNTLTRVEKISHKTLLTNKDVVYEAKTTKAGKPLLRFCVAYDYQKLVMLKSKGGTKQSFYGKLKLALSQTKSLVATFKSTNVLDTAQVINLQTSQLSESLNKRQQAVQNGPAVFFDLNDPSINAVKDSLKKQGLNEDTTKTLLSRQYSLNLSTLSLALTREYSFLVERYLSERNTSDLFKNFDPNRISEDISFYYDESYRLLAVVGENKTVEFNPVLAEETIVQRNIVPFEVDEGQPLSELDSLFSLLPKTEADQDTFSNLSGVNGQIAFITEDFVDLVSSQDKSLPIDFEGRSIVLSNQHYQKTILKVPTDPLSVITTSINGFFYNSNEIILIDQRRPTSPPVISQKLLKAPTNKIIDFFESNATPDSVGRINNQDISKFLLRYHYPRLLVVPSVVKRPADPVLGTIIEGATRLANITEQALQSQRADATASAKETEKLLKKIKQIPSSYPFSSKDKFKEEATRQLLIVAAATSKDPCLKDLVKILSRQGLNGIYQHVLTKFDWDQLVAKALLQNLDEINKIAQTAGDIKNLTESVNNCLDSLGVENVLESFTNLKTGLKNFEEYTDYAVKEIPGLKDKIIYTTILDFEQTFRRTVIRQARLAGVKALDFILGSVLNNLIDEFCSLDDTIEKLILEKLNNGTNLNLIGSPDIAGNSIGSNSADFAQSVEGKFEVDIIQIISDSNIEPLDNVLNGAIEIFPILSIESNKLSDSTSIIRQYLDSLSSNITPKQLKFLLDGTQNDDLVKLNELVVEDLDTTDLIKNELSSAIALAVLFKYLNSFISRNILDELIFGSINQTVDACFVKINIADSTQRQVLQDFLNTSSNPNEPLSDQLNTLANFISNLCASINNLTNLGSPASIQNLLSDFQRGNLLGLVDSNIQNITVLQNPSKTEAVNLTDQILQDFDDYISGINTNELEFLLPFKINNSQSLSDTQKQTLIDALKNLTTTLSENLISQIEEFSKNKSKTTSIVIQNTPKITLTKNQDNIIISVDGKELFSFKPQSFVSPDKLIGNLIQLSPVFGGPKDTTGKLAYYELILNRMATNKLAKGPTGYSIEIYKPDDFKNDLTDKDELVPFMNNFFDFLEGKIASSAATLPIKAEAFDINLVLNSVFEEQQVLIKRYQDKLKQTIDESTSGTEFYMSNLVKMKQLINKAKG